MFPSKALYDVVDVLPAYIKLSGYKMTTHSRRIELSDFDYTNIGQLSHSVGLPMCMFVPKNAVRMKHVFGTIAPFNVLQSVIGSVTVNVIDFIFSWNRDKKGFRHQANYEKRKSLVVFGQLGNPTLFISEKLFHQFSFVASRFTAYSSAIRNRIKTFVIRDWLPDFGGAIRLVGHNLNTLSLVLAPPSVDPQSGVNSLCPSLLFCERQIL